MLKRSTFPAILLIVFSALFFNGCHKDPAVSGSVVVSEVKMQVKTSASGVPDTFVFQYDSLGRQVYNKTDTVVTTYAYSQGLVTQNIALAGENFQTIYTTNAAGQATADNKGNTYVYDSLGYLIMQSQTGAQTYDSTTYTIAGGNVDSSVEREIDGSGISNVITTSYTYLPTVDSRNFGMSWLGKPDTYLINTETVVQIINGASYTVSYTYSYTFDAKGRVTQMTQSSGSATYTTTYTY